MEVSDQHAACASFKSKEADFKAPSPIKPRHMGVMVKPNPSMERWSRIPSAASKVPNKAVVPYAGDVEAGAGAGASAPPMTSAGSGATSSGSKGSPRKRRVRTPFSVQEAEALVQAVEVHGTGRWRDVKLSAFENADHRTSVDLKDKWKSLVRTAVIPLESRRGEVVPQQLLDRVLAVQNKGSETSAGSGATSSGSKGSPQKRRVRTPFSMQEAEALVQAVEVHGTGRWRDVKLSAFENADHRTSVDLKDKWKSLVRTAVIPPQNRRGEVVPQQLLDRVLAVQNKGSETSAGSGATSGSKGSPQKDILHGSTS